MLSRGFSAGVYKVNERWKDTYLKVLGAGAARSVAANAARVSLSQVNLAARSDPGFAADEHRILAVTTRKRRVMT